MVALKQALPCSSSFSLRAIWAAANMPPRWEPLGQVVAQLQRLTTQVSSTYAVFWRNRAKISPRWQPYSAPLCGCAGKWKCQRARTFRLAG